MSLRPTFVEKYATTLSKYPVARLKSIFTPGESITDVEMVSPPFISLLKNHHLIVSMKNYDQIVENRISYFF